MSKKFLVLTLAAITFFGGFLKVSAEENEAYLRCLCQCACTEAKWNCSVVSCYYDPSNECSSSSEGECYCGGYGCGRGKIDYTSECSKSCEQYRDADECSELQDQYDKNREYYIESAGAIQALNDYQYRATTLYHYNWLKLTTAFVYENLSPPATSVQDFAIDQVKSAFTDALMSELQDNSTKAEIQASLIRLVEESEEKINELRDDQDEYFKNMQDAQDKISGLNCTNTELQGIPKKVISREVSDLNDVSFKDPRGMAIDVLQEKGVIQGYDDETFKPEKSINRAEFLKILMESKYPGESSGSSCFSDVADDWYAPYVCAAKEKGIIGGYPDGSFKPGQTINTSEALKIILETIRPSDISSSDEGEWWQKYWDTAESLGILSEDIAGASQEINRGQMAEMVYRAMGDSILLENAPWEKDYYDFTNTDVVDIDAIDSVDTSSNTDDSETTTDVNDSPAAVVDNSDTDTENYAYVSANNDYEITYPSSWTIQDSDDGTVLFYGDTANSNGYLPTVNIQTLLSESSGGSYTSVENVVEDLKSQLSPAEGYKLISDQSLSDESTGASGWSFLAEYIMDGQKYLQWQVVLPSSSGDYFYAWAYTSPDDIYEDNYDTAVKMFDSWQTLE